MGSIRLHKGKIVELKTGEGKTFLPVLAAYLHAIMMDVSYPLNVNIR